VPAPATAKLGDAVGEMQFQNEEAVRDFQAQSLRRQQLITAASILSNLARRGRPTDDA
jgi:hypothetical protein